MDLDQVFERRNTHSAKWDIMEEYYGVSNDNGIPMHVAEMDFKPPQIIQDKVREVQELSLIHI